MTAEPKWPEENWDRLEAYALAEADKHRPDAVHGRCKCGFSVWSAEHVLVMSLREARQLTRLDAMHERTDWAEANPEVLDAWIKQEMPVLIHHAVEGATGKKLTSLEAAIAADAALTWLREKVRRSRDGAVQW